MALYTQSANGDMHPVDQLKNADPAQSKLVLDEREKSDWRKYACNGIRPHLSLEMVRAVLDSKDPVLADVQVKLREYCDVTPLERDVFILASRLAKEGVLEFDSDAVISMGDDNGAYVGSFSWVDFSGTPLDKEADEDEADRPQSRERAAP